MTKKPWTFVRLPLIFMVSALLASCGGSADTPDPLAVYKNQEPKWESCDAYTMDDNYRNLIPLFGDRVSCAKIRVPLDYAKPAGDTIEVAMLKVAAGDQLQHHSAIFLNPGGPGGDGIPLVLLVSWLWEKADTSTSSGRLFREIPQNYNLVGFSPRGTGSSTQLACTSPETLLPTTIMAADNSWDNAQNNLYNARLKAEACLDNPLTPHINSDTTARDMDIMRHLLHEEKLNYLGISYGTWLGTWYAGLFPERVGRMLLIGNTDITTPLNDTTLLQDLGMQRVLDDVLAPYAAAHPTTYGLGSNVEDVRQVYRSFEKYLLDATAHLLNNHISASANAHNTLLALVAAQKLQEKLNENNHAATSEQEMNSWISQATFVNYTGSKGNGTARSLALTLNKDYFRKVRQETSTVNIGWSDAVSWAVQCNDAGTSYDAQAWVQTNRFDALLYPVFGGFTVENPCIYWGGPIVRRPAVENVARAGSIVMLQSQMDPWTLQEGALKSFAALPNASMILVENDYTHFVIVPYGDECIDKPIAEYLIYGARPQRMTTCKGKPLLTYVVP